MHRALALVFALSLVLVGCQPASPSTGTTAEAPTPRPPKILRLALGRQIEAFVPVVSGAVISTGGGGQVLALVSNRLQQFDEKGNKFGELAEALPSLSAGTWKMDPDGGMETTWKLRPNLFWHDGQPITADDVVFGYQVVTTPGLPTSAGSFTRGIREVAALDRLSVVVRWREVFVSADEPGENLPVLPKHLLAEPFAASRPDGFANHPYFTSEFVGSGPFKVTEWVPGVSTDLAAFDQYYRGRPNIDRIVVRAISDFNTQIAGVLAGEIDLTLPTGIDVESALTVEERWQGTDNRVLYGSNGRLRMALAQSRPEAARPTALTDPRVLQALFRAVDRSLISEAISRGKAPPGDGIVPPFYDVYRELGPAMPSYPYDLAAAQRALQELGWARGADGVLRNAQGEQFHTEI